MRLIIKLEANTRSYIAYFEGTKLYGYGQTRELAVADLVDKVKAILVAVSEIQKDK